MNLKGLIRSILNKVLSEEIQELKSVQLLNNLISANIYIPITTSSLKLSSLQFILNDIVINRRTRLIEFGSGISTIAIARLIKNNGLSAHLFSVEENKEWLDLITEILHKENLEKHFTPIYAPLNNSSYKRSTNTNWYSKDVLQEYLSKESFDFVLIDAPSAWKADIEKSRYPALPFISNFLLDRYSLFLDDCDRRGEKQVLMLWEKEFDVNFKYLNSSLAYCTKGSTFNIL